MFGFLCPRIGIESAVVICLDIFQYSARFGWICRIALEKVFTLYPAAVLKPIPL